MVVGTTTCLVQKRLGGSIKVVKNQKFLTKVTVKIVAKQMHIIAKYNKKELTTPPPPR